uniref:Vomeronasal type-1 receptor n=2 Tax=Rhinopithecus TaxID=542827 RepID=A0A2K6JYQ5_RHIBE
MLSYFCLSLCCAIITSLHFCWPSTSPTGQDCIVVFLCHPTHQSRTQSIDAKLMNNLLAYIYGAFLVLMKQFHLSHISVLCFTAAFSKEFCEKYGVLQHYSSVTWRFNSYLYFSGITRNNDYLSGKSLKFLFKEIVIVGEICKA